MSVLRTSIDYEALPDSLLGMAKQHMRIDHTDDDEFVLSALKRAIGALEQRNDVLINKTVYDWPPGSLEFCNGRARIPFSPVNTFAADAAGDVSASYVIESNAIHGAKPQYLVGAYASGLVVTCTAGYAAIEEVPPRMVDRILRLTAHLYEHREILAPDQAFAMPDLALDATDWMPAV